MSALRHRILGAALLLAIAFAGFLAFRPNDGGALGRYQAGLRARREKLTFAELSVPPSTNSQEVASRSAFSAGPGGLSPANSFPVVPIYPDLMEFTAPGEACISWGSDFHEVSGTQGPAAGGAASSSNADWNAIERQCTQIEALLGQYRQALEHPTPDTGWEYRDPVQNITNGPPITFTRDRSLAYALVDASLLELHRGNFDAAFADLHALARMPQLNRNELTPSHQAMRIGFAGVGLNATWEALQAPGWNEPRLAALQQDWEQVGLFDALERGLQGHRAYGRVFFGKIRNARGRELWNVIPYQFGLAEFRTNTLLGQIWKNQVVPLAYKISSVNDDELIALSFQTKMVDSARLLQSGHPWPEVALVNSNISRELGETFTHDRYGRFMGSEISIPSVAPLFLNAVHNETERRLAISAIAVKRYEIRHGSAPANLEGLVPEFLGRVPIDPMSGKSLCYRLNPDSTFVLYSVGEDGKDDGGQGGMGLWKGPDAVWPAVALGDDVPVPVRVGILSRDKVP